MFWNDGRKSLKRQIFKARLPEVRSSSRWIHYPATTYIPRFANILYCYMNLRYFTSMGFPGFRAYWCATQPNACPLMTRCPIPTSLISTLPWSKCDSHWGWSQQQDCRVFRHLERLNKDSQWCRFCHIVKNRPCANVSPPNSPEQQILFPKKKRIY